ncbi:hypothetical protein HU200_028923 [Digitaria exilis]|uniref:Nucleotide-diphospho-sugar transferase domain-containing protein n=1 Tax=Digitaria exilis TaxID=1010633 RepID=A0A835BRJ7_9POAL|nr:hypothetical protein HU200_028923 [Digitaria exilis]CAB3456731.1 unnamed protein product [Digitaria exilis]
MMSTAVRNLLPYLVIISSTAGIAQLVLQSSPCPCGTNVPAAAHNQKMPKGINGTASSADEDKLRELLARVAMEDKTVIMAFTNEAWSAPGSLTDLFLESFRAGLKTEALLKHLLIVAMDAKAFHRCQQVHPLCYAFAGDGGINLASEQRYMAKDYLEMVWRRVRFQGRVLELGYSFLLTDVDIIWFRNPLLRIPVGADIAMSSDWFHGDNPYDLNKRANAGLVYARASPRTAAFYDAWHEVRDLFPGRKTQDVFEKLKHQLTARLGVTLQFVDTAYLGTFCDRHRRRDFNKLCTFHANCLVGLRPKVEMLRRVLDEWRQFVKASNSTALTD